MKIKTIFIGHRPARETPRNQGGGRAKQLSCEELIKVGANEMNRALSSVDWGARRIQGKVLLV